MRGDRTIYFVRHGETAWNAARRLQGQTDISLNDTGRLQAARNGRVLKEMIRDFSALDFVASPLSRARETMEIVRGEIGLERSGFRTDERLMEIKFGHWEGCTWAELPDRDPEGYRARLADAFGWCPRGGESYRDLTERIASWLTGIARDAVIVSHGGVSRVLRGHLLGIDPREVPHLDVPQDKLLLLRAGYMAWH
ncbi:MAG: phosphoglycerate mutase family protein [Hyphomicrobiaceae bacterium]|nr:phosphoglycerate mutase family protein [Hyphomicrobiaceae bacterium]